MASPLPQTPEEQAGTGYSLATCRPLH